MSNATNPDDLKLPTAPVVKIIKNAAGDGHNFSNEFKTAVARASAVFMLGTVDSALENANKDGRSTINAGDVVAAMAKLDHPQFQDKLNETLEAYRNKKAKQTKKGQK
uniref:DNA polymerase epsilon subunit 3 n=1 Tax=Panagrellus redivivus TaxID=6233 RepID=A0A7E4VX53_PANRE